MPYGFKYLLVTPDGRPHDPAAFVTAIPNSKEGEELMLGDGQRLRIVHINLELTKRHLRSCTSRGSMGCGSSSRPSSATRSAWRGEFPHMGDVRDDGLSYARVVREGGYGQGTLRCQECEQEAQPRAVGWLAFQVDLADDPDPPEVVVYCPACAAREFEASVYRVVDTRETSPGAHQQRV